MKAIKIDPELNEVPLASQEGRSGPPPISPIKPGVLVDGGGNFSSGAFRQKLNRLCDQIKASSNSEDLPPSSQMVQLWENWGDWGNFANWLQFDTD